MNAAAIPPVMPTYARVELSFERGEGAYLWGSDGRRYLDFMAGIAVSALGHAHPALVNAVTQQLGTLGHVSNFFTSAPQVELAERLLGLVDADGRVFLSNSGTEANEAALKLTRRTGRTRLVAMEGSFHGRTMGSLALTSKAAYREPFEPLPGDVTFVPYGDAGALAAAVDDSTAAVIVEPMQGEAGVVVPPAGFLAAAREVTTQHGALLWVDEVQTGIGRTGAWLAHTESGVVPDVVTLAKGLGGGVPIGATIGIGAAATLLAPGNHGTTFGGNPVACAAALAVLDTIEKEGLLDAALDRGDQLRRILTSVEQVTDVEGRGLLLGAQLAEETAAAVVARAQERGFLLNNTGPARLRFAPPLTITEDDVAALGAAWTDIITGADA